MSSSFRYTLTKLRSLPSSLYRWRRSSECWLVSAPSTSPTVEPPSSTESCLPAYWRRGVGIKTFAIFEPGASSKGRTMRYRPYSSVTQLFLFRGGLFRVRQPAVRMVELALLDRQHHERIPRARILQIRFRKVRSAIRMRMIDPHQVHIAAAGFAIRLQQIFRPQFIPRCLRTGKGILERQSYLHHFAVTVHAADHGAAALVGIRRAGVLHHLPPGFRFNADHSSSQKCSLKYFSALSQSTVTITPGLPSAASSL